MASAESAGRVIGRADWGKRGVKHMESWPAVCSTGSSEKTTTIFRLFRKREVSSRIILLLYIKVMVVILDCYNIEVLKTQLEFLAS